MSLRSTALCTGGAALAALVGFTASGCGPGEPSSTEDLVYPGANLMIISIDTLRADRLGAYGNTRGLTPHLDALAGESILFENAYANSPKTASSHMSLFTSMLPTEHGLRNFAPRKGLPLKAMASNRTTLGQVLNRNDYYNATIASGGNINGQMGFSRGFGQDTFMSGLREVPDIVSDAKTLLNRLTPQEESAGLHWFMFLHTYQVHAPYVPPQEWIDKFAIEPQGRSGELMQPMLKMSIQQQWKHMHDGLWDHKAEFNAEDGEYLMSLYDAEVAYTDHVIGRFIEWLDQRDILDDTILVVLSDHGEEFFEHGEFEHDQLHEEHLRVPLMIRLPGGTLGGKKVSGLTSLIDVMPTLLEMLDIEVGSGLQNQMAGESLTPSMLSGRTNGRPVFAERVMFVEAYQAALRNEASNVIFHEAEKRLQAFDLSTDPAETEDISGNLDFLRKAAEALKSALTRVLLRRHAYDQESTGVNVDLSSKELDELKKLGYIGDGDEDIEVKLPEGTPIENFPDLGDG